MKRPPMSKLVAKLQAACDNAYEAYEKFYKENNEKQGDFHYGKYITYSTVLDALNGRTVSLDEDSRGEVKNMPVPAPEIHSKVLLAEVVTGSGTDQISMHIDLPSPFPPGVSNDHLVVKAETSKGRGADYVRKHFRIEPRVIQVG